MSDTTHEDVTLETIAFGSCSKPWKDQSIFNTIRQFNPQAFLWSGDSYYTLKRGQHPPRSLKALEIAQQSALQSVPYQAMVQSLPVPPIGTYDDHDLGVNDGGRDVANIRRRMEIFWDFLRLPEGSPLRRRDGVFSAHGFGKGDRRVKVIALDTRTHRDRHMIPAVSFASTLINSMTRLFAMSTGLCTFQHGSILGEAQWSWLEQQLRDSAEQGVAVNVLVSSIQIFTPNPMIESWSQFPQEKQRLVDLLNRYAPQTLIIISGDVHIGYIQPLQAGAAAGVEVVEVTSSGLTHDCTDGGIPGFVCKFVWRMSTGWRNDALERIFIGKNFGTIQLDWQQKTAAITVRNASGAPMLLHHQRIGEPFKEIGQQEYPVNLLIWTTRIAMLLFLLLCVATIQFWRKNKNKKNERRMKRE